LAERLIKPNYPTANERTSTPSSILAPKHPSYHAARQNALPVATGNLPA
jgi:hypothetical protein